MDAVMIERAKDVRKAAEFAFVTCEKSANGEAEVRFRFLHLSQARDFHMAVINLVNHEAE